MWSVESGKWETHWTTWKKLQHKGLETDVCDIVREMNE